MAQMNAQVVTVASHEPTQIYYHYPAFIESLRRFSEVPTVLGMDSEWRGLMTKPFLLREWLRAGGNTSDRLIVADAFDIVFIRHPHWVGDRCAEWFGPDAVVFNGEKGCWPREDLRDAFPDDGSAWRFLNSGFMCGPADAILALVEAMDIESIGFDPPGGPYPNDQGEYQALFARTPQPAPMVVDTQCRVAQSVSGCEVEEFDFSGDGIRNLATGTEPGVIHMNGGAKEVFWPVIQEKWGLP